MASRICLANVLVNVEKSLLISSRQASIAYSQCSKFSTSSSRHATPPKKGKAAALQATLPKKGKRTLKIKKNAPAQDSTIGTPEERKAFRTRLVLSNTNANDVSTIQELDAQNMHAEDAIGRVFTIPGSVVDSLRAVGAFKRTQGWNNYRKPSFMMTREAWEIGQHMKSTSGSADLAKTLRKVIVGERRSGKSVLLLQIMSMAIVKGWVVLSIPESRELTDSLTTDYTPLRDSEPLQFMQMSYTARLLSNMARVNRSTLDRLKTTRAHDLPLKSIENPTLLQLAEIGAQDPELAWPIFEIIMAELNVSNSQRSKPSEQRPPILFCADNISYLFSPTHYQTLADNQTLTPIHPFDLLLPKHYVDCLTGVRPLENGGVVLGATSSSNYVTCPALEVGIRLGEARNRDTDRSPSLTDFWSPLAKIDRRVLDHVQDLNVTRLQGLSKDHARQLIEYWALSGLVRDHVSDDYLGQKWALSGGGVIGELEKAVVQSLTVGA